ncbi:hypothetical protein IFM89_026097 [Coptis chinensis]|uniref:Histone H2B n=1 Tax=Coptis chinensis TaxID=261450 RepID=A0A835HFN4_9MAGN|nr:hypothetical protein IFM89_026097 [Coptis chinensis]
MAPKRPVKAVVKTTKKVVEETVNVSVVEKTLGEGGEKENIVVSTQDPQVTEIIIEEKNASSNQQQKDEEPKKNSNKPSQELKKNGNISKVNEKSGTSGSGEETKRRKSGRKMRDVGESYNRYVYKVLKQVHPDMGISSKGMMVLNGLMNDMFERLAGEASKLAKYTGRVTMTSREIQTAVRLVLPGELGKHAIAEGTKAVTTYVSNSA